MKISIVHINDLSLTDTQIDHPESSQTHRVIVPQVGDIVSYWSNGQSKRGKVKDRLISFDNRDQYEPKQYVTLYIE